MLSSASAVTSVTLVAGKPGSVHVWFGRYVRSARLVSGTLIVR